MPTTENTNTDVAIIPAYSPAALVSIFSKAFIIQEERKIIQIRGIFLKMGKDSYGGFYYDKLKDESSDHTITLITSSLVHNQLKENTTILFNGYLTRKADKYGRIEFQVNFVELVNVSPNKYSDEEIKKLDLITTKLKNGVKDLDALIKHCVYNNSKLKIVVIIGKTAIIENDIRTALGTSVIHYQIQYSKVSLASVPEISNEILRHDLSDVDLICVARGGGELLDAFNQVELVETILNRKKIIASAIGHADDITLFEKVADKKFATPTAFGNYLKHIHEETVAELSQSKAKLQKDISEQLKAIYDGQLKNLNTKLDDVTKLYTNEKKMILESHENYKRQSQEIHSKKVSDLNESFNRLKIENEKLSNQLNEVRSSTSPSTILLIIIIIVVIIILFALLSH